MEKKWQHAAGEKVDSHRVAVHILFFSILLITYNTKTFLPFEWGMAGKV